MNKVVSIIIFCFFSFSTFAASDKIGIYVENLLKSTFGVLNDANLNLDQKKEKLQALLSKNLDFNYMSKRVLTIGNTNSASQKDLVDFKNVYSQYVILAYSNAVKNYTGQKITVKHVTKNSLGNYIVQTIMTADDGSNPIAIDYQVSEDGDGNFKIQDVITEGVSLLSTQRADFGAAILHGPNHSVRDLTQRLKVMNN
jgi:phospholipid transport system substrate-binding protein